MEDTKPDTPAVPDSIKSQVKNIKDHEKPINNKSKLLQLPRTWIILMTLRFLINIFGQRSYIHPDEFFQGNQS